MRIIQRIALTIPVLLAPLAASAIEPGAPERLIDHDGAVGITVRKLVSDEAPASGDYAGAVQAALTAFYGARNNRPVWVGRDGYNDAAESAMGEIGRAGSYGLEAKDYKLAKLEKSPDQGNFSVTVLADAELKLSRAILRYAYHAKGGRVDPTKLSRNLDRGPTAPDPGEILLAMASSENPAAMLRGFHPKHAQFEKLRQKYLALRGGGRSNEDVRIPPGPKLEEGIIHPQVALLRKRLATPVRQNHGTSVFKPEYFDAKLTKAVRETQKALGLKVDGVVGNGTRRALNRSDGDRVQRLLINMERWRWMPDNLEGDAGQYILVNIPEFRVRIVQNDKIVFSERAIMGKVSNQTPIFSDEMEWVEFHPVWYVPNSIKVKEILPYLKRSDSILKRHDLRMSCPRGVGRTAGFGFGGGWTGDIRRCSFTQPPSAKNVLGYYKFKFPNKHSVYLHDTPERNLFASSVRTYSHGCIRVRNPGRLAELILGKDQGMSASRIRSIVGGPRVTLQQFLKKKIPVHVTYFTARVSDEGKLMFFGDYYGHDRRIGLALNGKATLIGSRDQAPSSAPRSRVAGSSGRSANRDWISSAFTPGR